MNQFDRYFHPISFAVDEQLITLCAVLSGYLNFSHHKIIVALIIMAFSSNLPDVLSYYAEKITEKVDEKEAIELSFVVLISGILSTLVVLLPIILIKDTKIAIISSYILMSLILVLTNYYREKDIYKALMKLPLYALVCVITWSISKLAQKYLK